VAAFEKGGKERRACPSLALRGEPSSLCGTRGDKSSEEKGKRAEPSLLRRKGKRKNQDTPPACTGKGGSILPSARSRKFPKEKSMHLATAFPRGKKKKKPKKDLHSNQEKGRKKRLQNSPAAGRGSRRKSGKKKKKG